MAKPGAYLRRRRSRRHLWWRGRRLISGEAVGGMEEDRFELSSTYIANITDYQLSNSPY